MHGRTLLRDWIERRCDTDREAARLIGLDHTHLSQILGGRRSPGLANSVKIERVTGIPVESWLATNVGEPATALVAAGSKLKRGKA